MKTVRQAAIENTTSFGFPENTEFTGQVKQVYNSLLHSFEDGVEYAQKWTCNKEVAPSEEDFPILVKKDRGFLHIVHIYDGVLIRYFDVFDWRRIEFE